MSALAKIAGSYPVSYILPEWRRAFDVHSSPLTPDRLLPSPPGMPVQHSLPLFQLVRLSLSISSPSAISCGSPSSDTQPMSTAGEQPATAAAHHVAHGAAQLTAVKLVRRERWTEANIGVLRSDYPTLRPVRDISVEVGRSVSAIYGKARRLKLKRLPRGAAPDSVPLPLPSLLMEPPLSLTEAALPDGEAAPALPLLEVAPALPSKQVVKRTKLGGREGRWVRNDGALSVRMERLHLVGFHDKVIAAVLGLTSAAVLTRAWAINCPEREAAGLRDDVEAARLVDRQAAPLPRTVISLDGRKTLTRKRCNLKGDFFWGESKTRFCNDARRLPTFAALSASAPMHAW